MPKRLIIPRFLPLDKSEHVKVNGVHQRAGIDWVYREGFSGHIVVDGVEVGDRVEARYAHLGEAPDPPESMGVDPPVTGGDPFAESACDIPNDKWAAGDPWSWGLNTGLKTDAIYDGCGSPHRDVNFGTPQWDFYLNKSGPLYAGYDGSIRTADHDRIYTVNVRGWHLDGGLVWSVNGLRIPHRTGSAKPNWSGRLTLPSTEDRQDYDLAGIYQVHFPNTSPPTTMYAFRNGYFTRLCT